MAALPLVCQQHFQLLRSWYGTVLKEGYNAGNKYTRVTICEDTLTAIHSFCNFDFIDIVNDAIMLCNFTSFLSPTCNLLCNYHISHILQIVMH